MKSFGQTPTAQSPDPWPSAYCLPERANHRMHASRLAFHPHCLAEDATDPALSSIERLAMVRDRARKMREIRIPIEAVTTFALTHLHCSQSEDLSPHSLVHRDAAVEILAAGPDHRLAGIEDFLAVLCRL